MLIAAAEAAAAQGARSKEGKATLACQLPCHQLINLLNVLYLSTYTCQTAYQLSHQLGSWRQRAIRFATQAWLVLFLQNFPTPDDHQTACHTAISQLVRLLSLSSSPRQLLAQQHNESTTYCCISSRRACTSCLDYTVSFPFIQAIRKTGPHRLAACLRRPTTTWLRPTSTSSHTIRTFLAWPWVSLQ